MENRVQTKTSLSHYVEGTVGITDTALDHQIRERRRVKELLRYFQPFDVPARSEGKPAIGSDNTLTALAQLAALRLNCQRCFISLVDNTKQYILAEATQTVSLTSEDVYEKDNDELSFGQTVVDFDAAICPATLACFTSLDGSMDISSENITANRSYYVINDMSMLEEYAGRSYVRGWPHLKFYAEVPIKSPSGTCIGSLCVLDTKARIGLDVVGVRILGEISRTVMDHLELCVSRIQQNQAERMIRGLGHFVEGRASVLESSTQTHAQPAAPGSSNLTVKDHAEIELMSEPEDVPIARAGNLWSSKNSRFSEQADGPGNSQEDESSARPRLFHNQSTFSSNNAYTTSLSTPLTEDLAESVCVLTKDQTRKDPTDVAPSLSLPVEITLGTVNNNDSAVSSLSFNSVEAILFRAANLIREAVELNGVAFFDPRSSDGRLLTDFATDRKGMSRPVSHSHNEKALEKEEFFAGTHQTLSRMMSCSPPIHSNEISMPEETLQILLKRFPHGGLVTFDGQGIVGTESFTSLVGRIQSPPPVDGFPIFSIESSSDELMRIFPGITSLMIYSFWDNMRDRCVGHCVAWTSDPARVLRRQDFTYIASFSNSVIAELSRIEAIAADRAKSTFISSISHELRSPLHGIMASMEILRDLTSDDPFQELFGTIESCGSTLLDTIDNVLAFSQSSKQSTEEDGRLQSNQIQSADGPDSAVDLESLVEDVTSICLSGVQFRMIVDSSARPEQLRHGSKDSSRWDGVIVICDISPGDWVFKTNAAVWKRILLNLVGNALKYTSRGSIVVELRQEVVQEDYPGTSPKNPDALSSPSAKDTLRSPSTLTRESSKTDSTMNKDRPKRMISLRVKDSGKGMSQDYLTNYLFKPFYQENPLAPGTGLGLSIVERLVHSIDGKVSVTSEEGVGTEITAEVPMSPPEDHLVKSSAELSSRPCVSLGIVGLNPTTDLAETPTGILGSDSEAFTALASAVTRYAAASNMITSSVDSISGAVDVMFLQDSQYRLVDISRILALRKPVIVLCTEPLRTHEHASKKPMNVVLLSNPFGPRKFQQAINTCLDIRRRLLDTDLVVQNPNIDDLLLPHRPVPRSATPSPRSSGIENSLAGQVEPVGPSLLLVEDNPINLKLLTTSIKRLGLPFTTATNGVEAVEAYKASSTQILLVFMDIQMPEMDGIEASREIRIYEKENGLPRCVIVALTALDSPDAKQAAIDSGVDMFFTKPVSVKKLKELVTQHYN
ncbi:uncharacterized protein RCO7_06385 [Rhynchosporium graminicola]|uniref:histidine kinase n=1 Tax=Rhynchosporium graminicola TaxID=2792576 RepID=A0A1E1KKT2_9HELO|nr:uncharacterized protein RCO7_06385 [Rhynchosporium commune]